MQGVLVFHRKDDKEVGLEMPLLRQLWMLNRERQGGVGGLTCLESGGQVPPCNQVQFRFRVNLQHANSLVRDRVITFYRIRSVLSTAESSFCGRVLCPWDFAALEAGGR